MAASTSLYRKYRSHDFNELVGQEPVVRTLKNAIASGRIAQAYLFTGPRGVGKTSAARLLAKAANCLSDGPDKPCNKCANCLAANNDLVTDLIEIDAASNTGVDNIREIIERANFAPSVWQTKFYIIDEVHMLSVSAFNALLKTLEEPPPHTAFILATTEVHKVPATVASRCQRFDFRKIPLQAMIDRLRHVCDQEGIEADRDALELVARQGTGSLRDALSLLDQLRVFAEGRITLAAVQDMLGASGAEQVADFIDTLVAGDLAAGLKLINSVVDEGLDPRQFNRQVVEHLRGLMLVKSGAASGGDPTLLDVTEQMRARMAAQAARVSLPDLLRWTRAFAEADAAIRSTNYRQLPLEMALVSASLRLEAPAVPSQPNEQLPAAEPPRPRPTAPQPQPSVSQVPPPIQRELGALSHNGSSNGSNGATNGKVPHPPAEPVAEALPSAGDSEQAPEPLDVVEPAALSGFSADGGDAGEVEAMHSGDGEEGDVLAQLKQRWPRLVDQIMARSRNMAVVFRDPNLVRPYSVVGNKVTISFRYPIQAKRSQEEKPRAVIEEALSRVLGQSCILDSILFDEEGKAGEPADPFLGDSAGRNGPKPKKPSPYETTRGKAAMNIFGITKFED